MVAVFFGGWQVPFLDIDGFLASAHAAELPHVVVLRSLFGAFG